MAWLSVLALSGTANAQLPPRPASCEAPRPPPQQQRPMPQQQARPPRERPPPAEPDEFDNVSWGPIQGEPFGRDARGRPVARPQDMQQGALGDCWVISALAAVGARRPGTITGGLRTRQGVDNDGNPLTIHSVRLFVDGKPEQYDVTNHIPVHTIPLAAVMPGLDPFVTAGLIFGDVQVPLGPRYARVGPEGQTWGPLFERAIADAAGGYTRIGNGGMGGTALELITGQPSVDFDPNNRTITFAQFARDARTNAIVVGTSRLRIHGLFRQDRLITNHAYWVDTVDVRAGTVTVRNPHNYNDAVTMPWADFRLVFTSGSMNPIVAPRPAAPAAPAPPAPPPP